VRDRFLPAGLQPWLELVRWHKPTGRLILLIPAGWALWLTPTAPPSLALISQIVIGGLAVSAAGCIANDLWDRRIDAQVERTVQRPLARGAIRPAAAVWLLLVLLVVSLVVVLSLPRNSLWLCFSLAVLALPPILLYPSAKRWFAYPQLVLAFCWGFAVLIPWAATGATLTLSGPLIGCWLATVIWTFGFDTVYAMADRRDDAALGLRSSALSLGSSVVPAVRLSYALSCGALGAAAGLSGIGPLFWPIWGIASALMQLSCRGLAKAGESIPIYGTHFGQQAQLGALLLIGLILGQTVGG
tara:strand:+ start:17395 stop:18294 length:900 start_codon:yes stop_codon:yes gene_type:complete